jgi:two-component system, cell cycle sensor histidine kinase PleC
MTIDPIETNGANVLLDAIGSMEEAFVAYDANGCLIVCNQAFRDMYNYTPEQTRTGVHFRELGEIDVRQGNVVIGDDIGANYLERKKSYREALTGSFTVQLKDGRWIRTNDRRMANGGFVSVQVDITEVKKFEEELQQAKRQAETASQAKTEFLATMSHELRTPLTSIHGALGLLAGGAVGELTPHAQELTENALRNSERLGLLVNDILDMERVEAGTLDYSFMHHDLSRVLRQAVSSTSAYAERFQVSFEWTEILDEAPAVLDERRISQVMVNLLTNAAKFSHQGGKVEVALALADKRYRISVRDYGKGIPAAFREKVFDTFTQGDNSDTRQPGGTGLGLSISKSIIERHGGKLNFESTFGEGALFFFDLPTDG